MARNNAKCSRCGGTFPVFGMFGTTSAKRGGQPEYMCADCATHNDYYHTTNHHVVGTDKINMVFVGIENETSYTDDYARNAMFEYFFIPTHDCSIESDGRGNRYGRDGNTCEYVSGLMKGLNRASKFALTCDRLIADGHMSINDSCGTHFHVSIDSMKDENGEKTYMGYIRRFYHSIFVPLAKAMKENPEKTEKLFGRFFTDHYDEYGVFVPGYARFIDRNADENCRYNFINVVNNNNIEFRLNRFVNGKQYQALMKMEVEMVKCIVTNFCEHFNDADFDTRRYPNRTAYRKHKADVTANKLVKLYEKYTANM